MKITAKRAISALSAVNALNGKEVVVGSGQAQRVVTTPFKFGSTVHTIAKLRAALRPIAEAHNEAQTALMKEVLGPDGVMDPSNMEQVRLINSKEADFKKMHEDETELSVTPLKISQLKLDENDIPPWVLDALMDAGLLEDG